MINTNQENLDKAYHEVCSIMDKCIRVQVKFREGSSQYTLLRNRVKAMNISKLLIENKNVFDYYSQKDLEDALMPVLSILHKCTKAQGKYDVNTAQYNRYINILDSMTLCKSLIEETINKNLLL